MCLWCGYMCKFVCVCVCNSVSSCASSCPNADDNCDWCETNFKHDLRNASLLDFSNIIKMTSSHWPVRKLYVLSRLEFDYRITSHFLTCWELFLQFFMLRTVHIVPLKRYRNEWVKCARHWEMPKTLVSINAGDTMPDGIWHARSRKIEQCRRRDGQGGACIAVLPPFCPTEGQVWRRHYHNWMLWLATSGCPQPEHDGTRITVLQNKPSSSTSRGEVTLVSTPRPSLAQRSLRFWTWHVGCIQGHRCWRVVHGWWQRLCRTQVVVCVSVQISLRLRNNVGKACKTAESKDGYIHLCGVFVRHTRSSSNVRLENRDKRQRWMTKARVGEEQCERERTERENHTEKRGQEAPRLNHLDSDQFVWVDVIWKKESSKLWSQSCHVCWCGVALMYRYVHISLQSTCKWSQFISKTRSRQTCQKQDNKTVKFVMRWKRNQLFQLLCWQKIVWPPEKADFPWSWKMLPFWLAQLSMGVEMKPCRKEHFLWAWKTLGHFKSLFQLFITWLQLKQIHRVSGSLLDLSSAWFLGCFVCYGV